MKRVNPVLGYLTFYFAISAMRQVRDFYLPSPCYLLGTVQYNTGIACQSIQWLFKDLRAPGVIFEGILDHNTIFSFFPASGCIE